MSRTQQMMTIRAARRAVCVEVGVVVCVVGLALFSAAKLEAQATLPDASYQLVCDAEVAFAADPATLPCDRVFAFTGPPSWEGRIVGISETYVGIPEFSPEFPASLRERLETELGDERFILLSSVQMETFIEMTEGDPMATGGVSGTGGGSAYINFAVAVKERSPPPSTIDEVPVRIRVVGEVTIDGGEGGTGYGNLFFGGGVLGDLQWEQLGNGTQSVDVLIDSEFFWVGDPYINFKSAECTVSTRELPFTSSDAAATGSCLAVIDPIFELDQARFDLIYGANSFPLEDYYELVYSPNLPLPPDDTLSVSVPMIAHPLGFALLAGLLVASGALMVRRRHA